MQHGLSWCQADMPEKPAVSDMPEGPAIYDVVTDMDTLAKKYLPPGKQIRKSGTVRPIH